MYEYVNTCVFVCACGCVLCEMIYIVIRFGPIVQMVRCVRCDLETTSMNFNETEDRVSQCLCAVIINYVW